jgi:1-acyl-sn-glycerol-3-phosphate acyltransferase
MIKKIKKFFYSIPRILVVNVYQLLIRIKIINIHNTDIKGPAIFAINHITGADPIFVLTAFKKRVFFMADSDDFKCWLTNFFMRRFADSVPVFKETFGKNIKSFKELLRIKLGKNEFFGIFPEGKLNKGKMLEKFHEGTAYFSYKTKLPIIPVYLHNIKGANPKRWWGRHKVAEGILALILNIFRKIHIFIGNPIDPMAENIIKDMYIVSDKNSYKTIIKNINDALYQEFLDLSNAADDTSLGLEEDLKEIKES